MLSRNILDLVLSFGLKVSEFIGVCKQNIFITRISHGNSPDILLGTAFVLVFGNPTPTILFYPKFHSTKVMLGG